MTRSLAATWNPSINRSPKILMNQFLSTTIAGVFLMTTTVNVADAFDVTALDKAAIHTIIHSVSTLADRGDFESLEKLFAEAVKVDYTSAFGGESELKSPQALMTQWASLLPGFDRTHHQLSNIEIQIKGNSATATADVSADHYLNEMFWQIAGSYEYGFVKKDGQWTIDKMTFIAESEEGSRDIIAQALEQAKINYSSYLQRQQVKQVVIDFLQSLEDKDMDKFATLWAEDAILDMPFSPEGYPKRVEGKEALIQHYAAWPEISGRADFTDKLVFYPMQDATMTFAEWYGDVEMTSTGKQYKQRYGGLFHVVDGKIELFREYYDPMVFRDAFGLDADKK